MLGAIIGDIVAHIEGIESFYPDCHTTALTVSIMSAILNSELTNEESFKKTLIECCQRFGISNFGSIACVSPISVLDKSLRRDVARWTADVLHNSSSTEVVLFVNALAEINEMYPSEGRLYLKSLEFHDRDITSAIQAVIDAEDFEEAVSLGTVASITGALAEALFGIPNTLKRACIRYIPVTMISTIQKFHHRYPRHS